MNIPKYLRTLTPAQLQATYAQAIEAKAMQKGEQHRQRIIDDNEWQAATQYPSHYRLEIRRAWAAVNMHRTVGMTDAQADEWEVMIRGWASKA